MSQGYRSNSKKNNYKGSPEERAKTPKKTTELLFNTSQRTSKSLMKGTQGQNTFNLMSGMKPIQELVQNTRYFYLGKGNNHERVREIILLRKGLKQSTNSEGILFKWTQSTFGFKYHRLGKDCYCFNHFQFHREISNKQRLLWNMINLCESNKLNVFNYIPTTFVIDLTTGEEDLAMHNFIKFYNRNIPEGYQGTKVHSIFIPRSKYTPYLSAQQLHKKSQGNFYCKPICPKTFFGSNNSYLWILKPTFLNRGRGISLFNNLSEFEKLIWKYYEGEDIEDYAEKQGIGELFKMNQNHQNAVKIITDQSEDEKQIQEVCEQKEEEKMKLEESSSKNLKKQQNTSKLNNKIEGKTKEKKQITESKVEEKTDVKTQNEIKPQFSGQDRPKQRVLSFVVQKYIECPMLINERKFDIRVWALLNQNYQIYFFKEGYLRFSSHKYSTDNHTNPFIHLTNNSVQKYCNEYNEQSGNQITLSQFQEYVPNETVYARIQAKIRQNIWLSMCSARRKININSRKECFQLFGYDFMIDETYKVWLIEINTNPAIDEPSSATRMLVPRMLDDLFQLTIDRLFNLKYREGRQRYPVKGFADEENMWQFLGDYRQGVNEKTMGKRMSLVRR